MSAYADTSFLVSLYIVDANSISAATKAASAELPLVTSVLGELEITNAFALRMFRKELGVSELRRAEAAFRRDIEEGVLSIRPVTTAVYEKARLVAQRRTPRLGTRTLDILHVASALALEAKAFFTFDKNQRKLARAEGLKTG
ncbi:MAG: type II toxin-antitoxin system VapC family toxin [Acidobacteriota bacterium]|nr:type II toxin-antitoxin system VapC family toxin [Acidobacteriota bacterium]